MASLFQDLRFALRLFASSPGFALAALAALALGIGANAAVFTIANGFLLRNLPFAGSASILYLTTLQPGEDGSQGVSYPDFLDLAGLSRSFSALGAFARFDADLGDSSAPPTQLKAARLTTNSFSLLGLRPILGRDFTPADSRPGAPLVAILTFDLWKSRYNGNPAAVGAPIRVNGLPAAVVGVMGPGLRFPGDSSLWLPLVPSGPALRRDARSLTVFARLAPHASLASAQAEMSTLARDLQRRFPDSDAGLSLRVQSFNDFFVGQDTRATLLALSGAVGFVLLIACANVVNLLLARATLRRRELAIRAALGAGRSRLLRQLLLESLLLSFAAGFLGSLAGLAGVRAFQSTILPDERAASLSFPLDARVLAFLIAVTAASGLLAGLAPAWRLANSGLLASLREGERSAGVSRHGRRLSFALVSAELALAFVLLNGAGLMIRSFLKMALTPVGAQTSQVMSMDILLRPSRYPSPASQSAFFNRLLSRLAALPGVSAAGMASNFPGDGWTAFYYRPASAAPSAHSPQTGGVIVSPSYFPLLGVGAVRGRLLSPTDGLSGPAAVVVNLAFARLCWPNRDPIGQRLQLIDRDSADSPSALAAAPWYTVAGIVPDIVQNDAGQGLHDPLVYIPYRELPQREMVLAARTSLPPELLANGFRRAVQSLDPDLPVTDLRTLDDLLWQRTWKWRVYGGMFSLFAAVALGLASLGLYSVLAQSVNQRIPEIGVRIALGASRADVFFLILSGALKPLAIGLVLGLAASFAALRLLSSLLVSVNPYDPSSLASGAAVLLLSAFAGIAFPALRALHVDPATALRRQ